MPFTTTKFPGLLVFEPQVHGDSRGYFFESYNEHTFKEQGLEFRWVQDNQSSSGYEVIRGLHFQTPPNAQTVVKIKSNYWSLGDLRMGSQC